MAKSMNTRVPVLGSSPAALLQVMTFTLERIVQFLSVKYPCSTHVSACSHS